MEEVSIDLARNMGIALTSGIPNVGGTLSFFLDKILPSEIEKKYEDFIESLSKEVLHLQIEISESIIRSDEFVSLFNRMIDLVVCEFSEKKKAIAKNILLSAMTSSDRFNKHDYFEYLVRKLTVDEIRWLYFSDEFTRRNGLGPYSYLVKQNLQDGYQYISHITNKLIRYKLLDGNKISALGEQFIRYINNPICVFDEMDVD